MIDVIGIGGSLLDTIYLLPEYPAEDTKVKAGQTLLQCGGPVGTALAVLGRLGLPCAYLGAMGDDPAGRAMVDDFTKFRVETSGIRQRAGSQSAAACVIVGQNRASRTIIWSPGNAKPLQPEELDLQLMEQAQVLHLDGLQPEAALYAARWFKSRGKIVSLDGGSFHPGVEKLVELADWLVCAEEFALKLTGETDTEKAVRVLYDRYHPMMIAATQGKQGGIYFDGRNLAHYRPFTVDVADTTGAGDVFHGAFVYARLQGWDWPQVFRFASAVAALKCTRPGGRTGIPTLPEVSAFLKERP